MTGHSEEQLDAFSEWERAAWEQRAAPYAASLADATRGSIGALLDAARVGDGTRVLDVGTGPGFVALAALERGAAVTAVDRSQAMVGVARATGVDARAADVERLPFPDGCFQAVVGGYLLNHLARPEVVVHELSRVLQAGGRLALTVWDVPSANPVLGLFGPVVTDLCLHGVVPPGPDSQRFAVVHELLALLDGWHEVTVERLTWTVPVEAGAWFDAVADATPRTGAVLAQACAEQRAAARNRYVALAEQRFGAQDGRVALPAGAVLVSAMRAVA